MKSILILLTFFSISLLSCRSKATNSLCKEDPRYDFLPYIYYRDYDESFDSILKAVYISIGKEVESKFYYADNILRDKTTTLALPGTIYSFSDMGVSYLNNDGDWAFLKWDRIVFAREELIHWTYLFDIDKDGCKDVIVNQCSYLLGQHYCRIFLCKEGKYYFLMAHEGVITDIIYEGEQWKGLIINAWYLDVEGSSEVKDLKKIKIDVVKENDRYKCMETIVDSCRMMNR